jgi:hypothetical protein
VFAQCSNNSNVAYSQRLDSLILTSSNTSRTAQSSTVHITLWSQKQRCSSFDATALEYCLARLALLHLTLLLRHCCCRLCMQECQAAIAADSSYHKAHYRAAQCLQAQGHVYQSHSMMKLMSYSNTTVVDCCRSSGFASACCTFRTLNWYCSDFMTAACRA